MVLDTTVLDRANHRLDSYSLRIMLAARDELGYKIAIPEVVRREAAKHLKRDTVEEWGQAQARLRKLAAKLGADTTDLVDHDDIAIRIADRADVYPDALEKAADAILELPAIGSDDLADRAIHRIKPFDDRGKGLQDYMIWRSLLTLLEEDDVRVLLVTGNTNDFTQDGELHPDLAKDIEGVGKEPNLVQVATDADDVLDRFLKDSFAFNDDHRDQKFEDVFGKEAHQAARNTIGSQLDAMDDFDEILDPDHWLRADGDENLGVVSVDVGEIRRGLRLDEDQRIVEVDFDFEAVMDSPDEFTRKGWLYRRYQGVFEGIARLIVTDDGKVPEANVLSVRLEVDGDVDRYGEIVLMEHEGPEEEDF